MFFNDIEPKNDGGQVISHVAGRVVDSRSVGTVQIVSGDPTDRYLFAPAAGAGEVHVRFTNLGGNPDGDTNGDADGSLDIDILPESNPSGATDSPSGLQTVSAGRQRLNSRSVPMLGFRIRFISSSRPPSLTMMPTTRCT